LRRGAPRRTQVITVEGVLGPARLGDLLARLGPLPERGPPGPSVVVCDLRAVERPGLGAVDALARLHLVLRTAGCELHLRNAGADLRSLVALAGLEGLLRFDPADPA